MTPAADRFLAGVGCEETPCHGELPADFGDLPVVCSWAGDVIVVLGDYTEWENIPDRWIPEDWDQKEMCPWDLLTLCTDISPSIREWLEERMGLKFEGKETIYIGEYGSEIDRYQCWERSVPSVLTPDMVIST